MLQENQRVWYRRGPIWGAYEWVLGYVHYSDGGHRWFIGEELWGHGASTSIAKLRSEIHTHEEHAAWLLTR